MITEFAAIGLAAAAHVASIFLGLSFSVCAGLLGGLVCAAAAGGIFFLLRCQKSNETMKPFAVVPALNILKKGPICFFKGTILP